jgi:type I restriction enzyme S subunit
MKTTTKTGFKRTEVGVIPEDWEVRKLGELAKVNENSIDKHFGFSEIEYIDIDSVDQGTIANRQLLHLEEAPSRARRIVKKGDIIMSTVRPNLKHFAFIEEVKPNTVVSTGFLVVSSKRINPRFLYYYLTTDRYTDYLTAIADSHTSTYPSYNPDIVENTFVPYPNELEQETIASILSDLDSKIGLNRQMNKTLEAIGQSIFKHWFVDFEFPNEEGKPYKSSGGEMVEDELGEIPKGWRVSNVGQEVEIGGGSTPDTTNSRYWDGGQRHWATPKDLSGLSSPILVDTARKITDSGLSAIGGRVYPKGTLLLSSRAPIGYLAISDVATAVNQGIIAMVTEKTISNFYMFAWCRANIEEIKSRANGTTFLEISKSSFRGMPIIVPSQSLMNRFTLISESLYSLIRLNTKESITLQGIRDSLIPKLMSGKIRVPVEAR